MYSFSSDDIDSDADERDSWARGETGRRQVVRIPDCFKDEHYPTKYFLPLMTPRQNQKYSSPLPLHA